MYTNYNYMEIKCISILHLHATIVLCSLDTTLASDLIGRMDFDAQIQAK